MKNLLGCSTAIAVAFLFVTAVPAFAVVKKSPVSTPPKTNTKPSALTEGECNSLGGKVGSSATCNSGSMCTTTDENGNSHRVCISARKQ